MYQDDRRSQKPVNLTVSIEEYTFCVEEAVGDSYNVRVLYSLKRRDGEEINPQIQFGSLKSSDGLRTLAGSVEYRLSEDRKTIWIEERQSSSQKYDSETIHTVTLKDLTFGENNPFEPIEGTWEASYRIQINEGHTELIDNNVKIQNSENKNYYYQVSSIQLSDMGIHMEMKIPDNDITYLSDHFEAYLAMEDGSIIDLDLHLSIRGKKAPFEAYAGAVVDEEFVLGELYAVVVCGHEIIIGDKITGLYFDA